MRWTRNTYSAVSVLADLTGMHASGTIKAASVPLKQSLALPAFARLMHAAARCRKKLDEQYHFSCQFTADLIAMNASDFIITSTFQEIAGDADTVGASLLTVLQAVKCLVWPAQASRRTAQTRLVQCSYDSCRGAVMVLHALSCSTGCGSAEADMVLRRPVREPHCLHHARPLPCGQGGCLPLNVLAYRPSHFSKHLVLLSNSALHLCASHRVLGLMVLVRYFVQSCMLRETSLCMKPSQKVCMH